MTTALLIIVIIFVLAMFVKSDVFTFKHIIVPMRKTDNLPHTINIKNLDPSDKYPAEMTIQPVYPQMRLNFIKVRRTIPAEHLRVWSCMELSQAIGALIVYESSSIICNIEGQIKSLVKPKSGPIEIRNLQRVSRGMTIFAPHQDLRPKPKW